MLVFDDLAVDTSSVSSAEEDSDQFELQYLHQRDGLNLVAGVTYAEVDQEFKTTTSITFTPPSLDPGLTPLPLPAPIIDNQKITPNIEDTRGYVYGYFSAPTEVAWTLGMSYHDYDEDDIDIGRYNPKLGVQWAATDALSLRAAWFKVVKPALASNRTLEPTQVAGFNQYFDDTNATRSERVGIAADWKVNPDLFLGAEFSHRELKTPEFSPIGQNATDWDVSYLDWDEDTHRLYAYWTPAARWGLGAELVYDRFDGDEDTGKINTPHKVRTYSLPLRAQYFMPNGLFAGAGITRVDQEVDRTDVATYSDGDSDFTVVDVSVGYRFPKRMGMASLSVQNLNDEEFDYQDDSFREFQDAPSTGPFIPSRTVMARVTLNF